jgi:hypothetical protein
MGVGTFKIGDSLGASAPDTLDQAEGNEAIDAALGIPGGLIPAGGIAAVEFPAYGNLGTAAGSLHSILGAIVPGGGAQVLTVHEWSFEVAALRPAGDQILVAEFIGRNGTPSTAPIDLWAADNVIQLFAGGMLVSKLGTVGTTSLYAQYFAGPDRLEFNRDLVVGDLLSMQRQVFV